MYYPSSENKGADQLRSYCAADLRLCFRICVRLTTGPVPPNRPNPTNGPILTTGPIVSSFPTNGPIFPQLGRLSNVISTNGPNAMFSVTFSHVNVTKS